MESEESGQLTESSQIESGQLTELRQTESGQADTGQKIQTESGQQTDTGHDFPENPAKNETKTGHGQYYPPTCAVITEEFFLKIFGNFENFWEFFENF